LISKHGRFLATSPNSGYQAPPDKKFNLPFIASIFYE